MSGVAKCNSLLLWQGVPTIMPVRKTKKAARKIELEIRDSSDDEDGTVDAENLEDKVTKANLKRYNYYHMSENVKENHKCASTSDFVFMFLQLTILIHHSKKLRASSKPVLSFAFGV